VQGRHPLGMSAGQQSGRRRPTGVWMNSEGPLIRRIWKATSRLSNKLAEVASRSPKPSRPAELIKQARDIRSEFARCESKGRHRAR
jgi:hypothetical protein